MKDRRRVVSVVDAHQGDGLCSSSSSTSRSVGINEASRQIIDEYQPHVIRADNAANE